MSDMGMHGAHPMFNLWEGNVATTLNPDSYWGSSSHNTAFRNWFKGTTKIFPPYTERGPEQPDDYHWAVQANNAITLDFACRTYNLAGNVVGSPDMLQLTYYNNGTTVLPTVPITVAPTIRTYDSKTYGYSFGYASSGDNGSSHFANDLPYTTAFIHGDVNISDDSAVLWDEATVGSYLPPSLYLVLKPAWFGNIPWPAMGPDVPGFYNQNSGTGLLFPGPNANLSARNSNTGTNRHHLRHSNRQHYRQSDRGCNSKRWN